MKDELTRTIEEIVDLYGTYASGVGQGIYTKSITKDEAVQKLVKLVQEARIDEIGQLMAMGGQYPVDRAYSREPIVVIDVPDIDRRIKELSQ